MPTYKIRPCDGSFAATITTTNAAAVLKLVQRLDCKQADVMNNGTYAFTLRLDSDGLWCVYQRDQNGHADAIDAFG